MHNYDALVPVELADRRRQAPPRRDRRNGRLTRRAGGGLVALGTALASTGQRLQEPAARPAPAAC